MVDIVGAEQVVLTATGVVHDGPCKIVGMQVATDGSNDPEITVYDNATAASGTKVIPTCQYDASALNLNGFTTGGWGKSCMNGAWMVLTDPGGGAFSGTAIITFDIVKGV